MALVRLLAAGVVLFTSVAVGVLRCIIGRGVNCSSRNRLDGKVVLITGATSGIGRAAAKECARRGAHVLIASRDKARAGDLLAEVNSATPPSGKVTFLPLNLECLHGVREFVAQLSETLPEIDVIINNAAYMGTKAETTEGLDYTFVVNYLSHFLMTFLLLRAQGATNHQGRSVRVINLISGSWQQSAIDFNDLMSEKKFDIYGAYGQSKLAMLLFSIELARRPLAEGRVISMAVHPGAVCSGLQANWPGVFGYLLRCAAKLLFRTPEEGAQTVVYCACVSDSVAQTLSGKLLYDCQLLDGARTHQDDEVSRRLWRVSSDLCGLGTINN